MTVPALNTNDEIVLSNTLSFARALCETIAGMGVDQFVVRPDTLVKGWRPSANSLSLHIPFFGRITGHYLLSFNEQTAARLITADQSVSLNLEKPKEAIDLLKETLNIITGRSIAGLEQSFGQLTYFQPIVVTGTIEFPPMLSASVEVESYSGRILCVLSLDLAQLVIGRKLEEAEHKLDAVRVSQRSTWMIPAELPDARFSVIYKSLNEAGGDLYDVIKVDDNQYGFFVGDVSGHDISTAFIAASMRALIKQNCVIGSDQIESMQTINRVLYELLPNREYITGCYAVLDRRRNVLKVVNMGHPPLVLVPRNGLPVSLAFAGDVLGAFKEGKYQVKEHPVSQGDRFIMYTDGLLELYGGSADTGGVDFSTTISETVRTAPMDTMAECVFNYIYKSGKKMRDDVIVLGVEV
jgi:CheY-specific phosphatase CheX